MSMNPLTELKDMYEKRGKEAMFRSKARWIEKGEKPTRYFFNLEKRNFEKKTIAQLKLVNGEKKYACDTLVRFKAFRPVVVSIFNSA